MAIWKGGPINNIDEMGAAGNIICVGPLKSLERFLEIETASKYFDKEVYSAHGLRWGDPFLEKAEDNDGSDDVYRTQIALEWFSKLIPSSILNLSTDFPDCNFEVICEFMENNLSDWANIKEYREIPEIEVLLKKGLIDGNESLIIGSINLGESYKDCIYEELKLESKNNKRHFINHNLDLINGCIDFKKSFLISE
jgi:hypothetical protein